MKPLDWSQIQTRPLSERKNKVFIKDFSPWPTENTDFLDLMPNILVGQSWPEFINYCAETIRAKRTTMVMIGGHVVKTGVTPLLIDLMKRGYISHLGMNGAGAIHDYEIALIGATSENVAEYLEDGRFGLWEETCAGMNAVASEAASIEGGPGFGKALGKAILEGDFPHREYSILATAVDCGIPVTVHAALGAEIIHEHPSCSGAAIGEVSYRDFRLLTDTVAQLEKGVVLNWGSAVIMPEVFLKALSVARNLGQPAFGFSSATFDMLRQYRPLVNVVERPTGQAKGTQHGKGYLFTGHHEILIPLFYHSLTRALR